MDVPVQEHAAVHNRQASYTENGTCNQHLFCCYSILQLKPCMSCMKRAGSPVYEFLDDFDTDVHFHCKGQNVDSTCHPFAVQT